MCVTVVTRKANSRLCKHTKRKEGASHRAQGCGALSLHPPLFSSLQPLPRPGEVDGDDEAGEGRNEGQADWSQLQFIPISSLYTPVCLSASSSPMLLRSPSPLDLDLDLASPDLAQGLAPSPLSQPR